MLKEKKAELRMPSRYVDMSQDEMIYLEGGMILGMRSMYLNKPSCETVANEIIKLGKWTNITISQLKKEIYAHAYVYYNWSALAKSKIPFLRDIYESAANGISICDGVDKRQIAFEAIWLL